MSKIEICSNVENLKQASVGSVIILPYKIAKNLVPKDETEKIEKILENLAKIAPNEIKNWFDLPNKDIIIFEVENKLKNINNKIKIIKESAVPLKLLDAFIQSGIIPVLIV